ncbi:MFS transporter [Sphaerisporangium flaviroseum]|uniref:MFS transporter n=1 Tax=Sphaerisporangium flaviroseum TaxID=509199 RepID=UPI0031EF382D
MQNGPSSARGGHPNGAFRRMFLASLSSAVAFRALGVVYPLIALGATHSPAMAGWVGFAWTIPGVVAYIPAGVLVDRWGPRRVMLITEGVRIAFAASVLAAALTGGVTLIHLIVAAFVEGTMWILYSLAETALVPALVDDSRIDRSNARLETGSQLAALAGRPLGGFLLVSGPVMPFAINVALFTGSLFLVWRIRERRGTRQPRGRTTGIKLWPDEHFLRALAVTTLFTNFMIHMLIMVFITGSAQMSSTTVGLVLAAGGIGGAIASSVANWITPPGSMLLLQIWTWTLALLIAAVWSGPVGFGIALFLSGCIGGLSNVALRSFESRHIDEERRARVASVSRLAGRVGMAVAAPLGGLFVHWFQMKPAAWILCGFMAVAALLVSSVPTLRKWFGVTWKREVVAT